MAKKKKKIDEVGSGRWGPWERKKKWEGVAATVLKSTPLFLFFFFFSFILQNLQKCHYFFCVVFFFFCPYVLCCWRRHILLLLLLSLTLRALPNLQSLCLSPNCCHRSLPFITYRKHVREEKQKRIINSKINSGSLCNPYITFWHKFNVFFFWSYSRGEGGWEGLCPMGRTHDPYLRKHIMQLLPLRYKCFCAQILRTNSTYVMLNCTWDLWTWSDE